MSLQVDSNVCVVRVERLKPICKRNFFCWWFCITLATTQAAAFRLQEQMTHFQFVIAFNTDMHTNILKQ